MHHRKWPIIVTFLAPTLLLYGLFVLLPYGQAIYISLTDWQGFSPEQNFVGLTNYVRMLHDGVWWTALGHNVIFLVVLPVVTLGLAFVFAGLLTQGGGSAAMRRIRGSGFYRVVYFFPYVMPVTVTAVLWQFIYTPGYGLLDGLLRAVHLNGLERAWLGTSGWLGNPRTALPAIAVVAIWTGVGFYMVLFIAGIQGIPRDVYEAAAMDGAGRMQALFRVTLPLLWNQVQVAMVYIGIAALDMFALVQIMSSGNNGGPDNSTEVMADYLYRTAFGVGQWGYSAAMGVALVVLSLALAVLTFRFTARERIEF
jgi:N-acetylglucosamine transport system permease protein